MSFSHRLFLLFPLVALAAMPARAQTRPEPPPAAPAQQVMTLRVTLPTAVGYAMRLLSKDDNAAKPAGKTAPRTSNPVLVFTVPLPQLLSGKKAEAPAAPKND
ncbi:hypothetical protein [Hymenobacter jeollabukensis]|uniref:Uncharacterized protein n=1 Tax=Hymenobacter jeollabukensis TaxID=2025313 RepID=A0A5R8WY43_9BACT|nr:hypothetical protein [Hymenobacter jeollabukensis]TLM96963.1 hypothetical protein FDY95_02930 [Hymenobacter jeollabukensis]